MKISLKYLPDSFLSYTKEILTIEESAQKFSSWNFNSAYWKISQVNVLSRQKITSSHLRRSYATFVIVKFSMIFRI